jgi:hypothetical protein
MLINSYIVANKLNEALSIVGEVLSKNQREDISMFINAEEWGLALETLCEFLYEEKLPITLKAYELLKEVGSLLKLNSNLWENLKRQLSD